MTIFAARAMVASLLHGQGLTALIDVGIDPTLGSKTHTCAAVRIHDENCFDAAAAETPWGCRLARGAVPFIFLRLTSFSV